MIPQAVTPDLINWIFGFIAIVGGGLSTLLLGTVKTLRDSNEDLRARDADREKAIVELKAKVATLEADRDALQRVVRRDDEWQKVSNDLMRHNAQAREHWAKYEHQMDVYERTMSRLMRTVNEILDLVRGRKHE